MLTPESLKEIRSSNKLSQEDLGKMMNVHPNYISRLENGNQPISYRFEGKLREIGLIKEEIPKYCNWQQELNLTDSECEKFIKLVKENKYKVFLALDALDGSEDSVKIFRTLLDNEQK